MEKDSDKHELTTTTGLTRLSFGLVTADSTRFEDLVEWMRSKAKIDLVVARSPAYKELVLSIRDGSSDIAWLPPVPYAWLAEAVTPIASIVREGSTTYASALVVRKESKLNALTDLKGVRAGWADPWSAAGYVVPRLELARKKIEPSAAFKSEKFYGSHREALLALGRDECDVVGTYARLPAEGQTEAVVGAWSEMDALALEVRVLATFGSIPPDVIAVRRNLAPREHEQVMQAFRDACGDETARPFIRAIFGGEDLREGLVSGHDKLRLAYELAMANGLFD